MASFASISIRFSADLKQFSSQMDNAQRRLQKVGKQMQSAGKNLTVGLTAPIVALGYKSVVAFDKQAKAIAQVEAGIKSTGQAAGFTSEQLQKMASDLQNNTIFGDEEILQGTTSQLLTFTNIAGEQFARTQQAALDLATRLDGDLKSSAIQLGKALNDPVANLSALSRSGIQFSKDQKAVINSLVESNRLADAQTIILDELEKQYGGAAEAAAKAGLGPFTQFSNILGDIMEQFGEIIAEYLTPFIAKLKDLALRFQNLDKSTKQIIVVIGSLAAALGPVLLIVGTLVSTALPALAAGFTALTGPVGLVVAAIAGIATVIYQNWDRIKAEIDSLKNYFTDLYNESLIFRIGIEQIVTVFNTLYNVVKLVVGAIVSGFTNGADLILNSFKNIGAGIKAVLTGDISEIPKIFARQAAMARNNFKSLFKDLGGDIGQFVNSMSNDIDDSIARIQKEKRLKIKTEFDFTGGKTSATNSPGGFEQPETSEGTGNGREKVESVNFLPQIKSPLDDLLEKLPGQIESFGEQMEEFKTSAEELAENVNGIIENAAQNAAVFVGELAGNLISGQAGIQDAMRGIMGLFSNFMKSLGEAMIAAGTASEAFKKIGLTGIPAIAAGVALIALSGVVKNMLNGGLSGSSGGSSPRPMANGGIVYTATNALVGEYAGARSNPEVVAPLNKLKGMLADTVSGGNVNVSGEFRIRGNDLLASIARSTERKSRWGG